MSLYVGGAYSDRLHPPGVLKSTRSEDVGARTAKREIISTGPGRTSLIADPVLRVTRVLTLLKGAAGQWDIDEARVSPHGRGYTLAGRVFVHGSALPTGHEAK